MQSGIEEARRRLGYIHQYRERGLGAVCALALVAKLFGAAFSPTILWLLAGWWLLSLHALRGAIRMQTLQGVYRLEFVCFAVEIFLLAVLSERAGWPLLIAVMCYTVTILSANVVLPPRLGFWITLCAGAMFTASATLRFLRWPPDAAAAGWMLPTVTTLNLVAMLAGVALFYLLIGTTTLHFTRMFNSKAEALALANRELKEHGQELRLHRDHLEELVRQRTNQLELATADLRRANHDLTQLNQVKSNFLANVSHEMRTPLTSIRAFSEILLSYPDEDRLTRGEFIETIISESDRLTWLINDVLDLAKIESGKMEWRKRAVLLGDLVGGAIETMRLIAERKGLALSSGLEADLPLVSADPDRIRQVFTNLIANAVKFTPAGSVHVGTLRRPGEVVVFIADTGRGIAPEELDRIFEKFHQSGDNNLTGKPEGSGLGLSICREILHHHGGRIWAESQVGLGSTFFCALPTLADSPAETSATVHA